MTDPRPSTLVLVRIAERLIGGTLDGIERSYELLVSPSTLASYRSLVGQVRRRDSRDSYAIERVEVLDA